jgi:hypothetical protein
MFGFIGTSVTISLNYIQYSAIVDLHNLQLKYETTMICKLTCLDCKEPTEDK